MNLSSHKRREFLSQSVPNYKIVSQHKEKSTWQYKKIMTTKNVFSTKPNQTALKMVDLPGAAFPQYCSLSAQFLRSYLLRFLPGLSPRFSASYSVCP